MKVIFLVFLSLLTAEITGKSTSPDGVVSGDYLEKEKEEDDDDENTTNVEQIPVKFIPTKGAEEESSQEEQALEPRFGPHLDFTTLTESHSEEPPRDVPDNADLPQKSTAQETSQEDFKANVMLAVSCTTLACSLIFLICFCMAFIKYRMEKGNFCPTFRCSREQQTPASASYFVPLKRVPGSSASRAAESSLWGEKTASDIHSNGKSTESETLPIINSIVDMLPISHASSPSSIPSCEDLSGDHI